MRVTFGCGGPDLEGELTVPDDCQRAAVVCHPHPQYGGDMDNSVVQAVTAGLQRAGFGTLRFNFRGVGASAGSYGGGAGETDDARCAVRYLIERSALSHVTLAGYSFGAMIALRAGTGMPEVDRLIALAPPLAFFELDCLAGCAKAKLFIVGDRDQYCSVAQLTQQLVLVAEPKVRHIVSGADHFFVGHEAAISDVVRSFVGA